MRDKVLKAAQKGFLGYSALLEPEKYTDSVMSNVMDKFGNPSSDKYSKTPYDETPDNYDDREEIDTGEKPTIIAQNDKNAFGLEDRLKTTIIPEDGKNTQSPNIRTKARAKRNEELMKQGKSAQEIQADEAQNPMD